MIHALRKTLVATSGALALSCAKPQVIPVHIDVAKTDSSFTKKQPLAEKSVHLEHDQDPFYVKPKKVPVVESPWYMDPVESKALVVDPGFEIKYAVN